jgi:hypothetical protein
VEFAHRQAEANIDLHAGIIEEGLQPFLRNFVSNKDLHLGTSQGEQ